MDLETIRVILREYGLTPNTAKRPLLRGGTATTVCAVRGNGVERFQCYLGTLAVLSRMDEASFRLLIEAKCTPKQEKLMGRYKCAKESCIRRAHERNKAVIATGLGRFTIYLCDDCFNACGACLTPGKVMEVQRG